MTRAAWAVVAIASSGACGFKASTALGDAAADATPDAAIDAPSGPPSLAPELHDYGAWFANQALATSRFIVSSKGATSTLATSLSGTNAGDFMFLGNTCAGVALPALSICTIDVAFHPVTTPYGAKSATLVVSGGGVTLTSTLTGRYELAGDLAITGTPFSFSIVHVGSLGPAHTVTVTDSGSLATGSLTLVKSGPEAAEFTIANDTCSGVALQGLASCTFDVAFAPNGVGAKSAIVDIAASPGGTVRAVVDGTGQALTIAPAPADFGTIALTTTSLPQTLTVTNVAAAAVGPLVTSRAGNHPNDFALATDTCNGATLAPTATCTIAVTFAPTLVGNRNALVRLTVGGTIIADGIVQGVGIPLDPLVLSPLSYMFTATTSGQTSTIETFTLFNTGLTTSGTIASALSGTDPTQFAIVTTTDTCTGLTVPAGGQCTIDVRFSPTTTGPKTATLTLSTTTPAATASATLTGTGL